MSRTYSGTANLILDWKMNEEKYQFKVKADELQPRDKCKKQSEMIMTANQCISVKEETYHKNQMTA